MVDMASTTGIPKLTLRSIRKKDDKIKKCYKNEIWMMTNKKTR